MSRSKPHSDPLFGAIEAGGTKFICAVGARPDSLQAQVRIPTTTPEETLGRVTEFFRDQQASVGSIAAIGIGAFGPVDVRPTSSSFGWFLDTPKPGWQQIDFAGTISRELGVKVGFDTDVNAAALGEHQWGNAQGIENFVYLTVGTGIGGGGMASGKLIHGLLHPEMGHMLIPHNLSDDPFAGVCPFHQDCLEGLASGVAIEKRWGQKAVLLPPEHPAWPLEAHYLALGVVNLVLALSPQRIIIGGGVMEQAQLFSLIRNRVRDRLSTYLNVPEIIHGIDSYILPPKLGGNAGLFGAFALAKQVLEDAASVNNGS